MEIDIELAPGDQSALPKTKEQAERDTGNQLHMLTNRHDKFLDSLREVKVAAEPDACDFAKHSFSTKLYPANHKNSPETNKFLISLIPFRKFVFIISVL